MLQFYGIVLRAWVLRAFTPELCQQLQQLPEMELRGIQRSINEVGLIPDGEYTVRFSQKSFSEQQNPSPSVAIVMADGSEKQFGAISNTSIRMPQGSLAKVFIETEPSGTIAKVQVIEKLDSVAIAPESERHALTSQEARDWYAIARGNNDIPLAEHISVLGSALQHYYNQEQGGEGQLKPPSHYSHPAVTISQEERQQMAGDPCGISVGRRFPQELNPDYTLSIGEARHWYGLARLKGDRPLLERMEALGNALNQHYYQEQRGEENLKPPDDYSHPDVTIPVAEQHQIETDISAWQEAIIPKPSYQRRSELAL